MAVLLVGLMAQNSRAEQKGLCFGLISTMKNQTVLDIWQPLVDDMAAAISIPIKTKVYDDYAGVIWAMAADKVQIAAMGNKSALEAVDRASGEVAFRKVDLQGTDGYWSHLITNMDSGLEKVDDIFAHAADLTFGSGDPNSTSGYVVPGYYVFARRGLEPQAIFERVTQANHQENLFAVAEGRVAVATSNSIALERFKLLYPEKYLRIKVIWTSPLIPSDPIVWRKSLPDKIKAGIKEFLLDYGQARDGKSSARVDHERAALRKIIVSRFIESNDLQLMPIRELELFRLRSLVDADASFTTAQRNSKLQEIDSKLKLIHKTEDDANR